MTVTFFSWVKLLQFNLRKLPWLAEDKNDTVDISDLIKNIQAVDKIIGLHSL